MNLKKFIILPLFLTIFFVHASEEKLGNSWHFDTNILRDNKITKRKLLDEGFTQITLESEKNILLQGLFLKRDDATCTIICCHGFCPGGKEGFAPFVKLAPDYCNLLFIDLRGYGESQGPSFIPRVKNYGESEFKDIFGAIQFVQKETNGKPQIVFGWCSGAFHAATTLLKKSKEAKEANVKGLIFDSGFGSLMEVFETPYIHMKERFVPGLFAGFYGGDRKRASQSYICKIVYYCFFKPLMGALELYAKPSLRARESETNLYDKIDTLAFPTLIIHAKDDNYAPWKYVEKLVHAMTMPDKELWLIPEGLSSHANNHLRLKDEYKFNMQKWIEKIIA